MEYDIMQFSYFYGLSILESEPNKGWEQPVRLKFDKPGGNPELFQRATEWTGDIAISDAEFQKKCPGDDRLSPQDWATSAQAIRVQFCDSSADYDEISWSQG